MRDLKSLDAELAKDSMRGLWAREEAIRREPVPFGKPVLWKWAKIRAGLEAAGQLITTNYKGARRAISLVHPNMVRDTPEGHLEVPLHPAAERFWRQCGYLP